jgi:hypothetical protein
VHEPVVRLPLSSQPQAGAHLVQEGAEPLMDVELLAGDALYLPRGYVHAALTTDDDSVHLTVGVLSTTWYDLLRDLLTLAGKQEEFRDALPVQPADSLDELLPGFLRSAADWLESVPLEEVRQLATARLARSAPVEPLPLLATASAVRLLDASTALRPRRGLAVTLEVVGQSAVLTAADRTITLPAFAAPALRQLLAGPCTPAELSDLDESSALVLARRLLREGIVLPG